MSPPRLFQLKKPAHPGIPVTAPPFGSYGPGRPGPLFPPFECCFSSLSMLSDNLDGKGTSDWPELCKLRRKRQRKDHGFRPGVPRPDTLPYSPLRTIPNEKGNTCCPAVGLIRLLTCNWPKTPMTPLLIRTVPASLGVLKNCLPYS